VENLALAKRRLSLTSAALGAVAVAFLFYGGLYLALDRTASTMLSEIKIHMATVAQERQ
jgi:type VI secretion system protein ImpK